MFDTFDGFSLVKNGVAFRAMYKKDGEYVSPTNDDFVWGSEGIAVATCQRAEPYVENMAYGRLVPLHLRGSSWHSKETIPHDDCTCGLYGAYEFGQATVYEQQGDQAVLFMVEAHGDTIYYDNLFRSAEMRIIACVGHEKRFSDDVACDYFRVPFISLTMAKAVMDIQNSRVAAKHGFEWKPFYVTQALCDDAVSKMPPLPDDESEEVEDPSLTQAMEWPFK